METVLVIDDEPDIVSLVRHHLSAVGYSVIESFSGDEGLRLARLHRPQMAIVDLMLPGLHGRDVCTLLRRDFQESISLVVLSARGQEVDVLDGFDIGVDDYVVKPFSPKVLVARVQRLLGRTERHHRERNNLVCGSIALDCHRKVLTCNGRQIPLTATEFRLLEALMRSNGDVLSRLEMVERIHGEGAPVTDRSIDVQILALRRKMEDYGHMIETIRGFGYRLQPL